MQVRTKIAALGLLFVTDQAASATTITPSSFSSHAKIETFDSLPVGSDNGPLNLSGVSYEFTPNIYQVVAADPSSYLCISGNCIGNGASGANWKITLSTAANLVGGYLTGAQDSLVLSSTNVSFYDASNKLLGSIHPVPVQGSASSPSFFGFESDDAPIKYIYLHPNSGVFMTTLDNFTTEVLAPVPEPSTWAMMLLGFAVLSLAAYRHSMRTKETAART